MKRYTIKFSGGKIEINAKSEHDVMKKFRVWIVNMPGEVWIAEYNCIK